MTKSEYRMTREIPSTKQGAATVSAGGHAGIHGFTVRPSESGAAMLAVIMFIMVGGIALTAVICLMGARLQQSELLGIGVQRHIAWGNTKAINQQYALTWAMRDNVSRSLSTGTVTGAGYAIPTQTSWGGVDADVITNLAAFRSTVRPSTTTASSYPFNNIQNTPTSDNGVYFTRITADSDSTQTEHLAFYNYLKTYPTPLLGDLLIVHKKPATATGAYYLTDNLDVDGRVVIWDETAETINLRAESCLNMTKTGTNTVRDSAAATILPQNFGARVTTTAGYGGTGTPTAVTNGSLNLINNTDFTAASLRHTMEATGTAGTTWLNCTTGTATSSNINTNATSGNSTSDTQVKLESTVTYALPTTSPYGYTKSGNLNVLIVRLKNSTLKHLRITSGVEQLVLEGQTNSTDYTNAGNLAPVIIWLEQADCRDIRFVGENNRRLILATGKGTGATLYASFHGNSIIGGSALRWRIQWINEFRIPYLNTPTGLGAIITGSIRTDWGIYSTDTGSTVRVTLQRETNPGALETLLPRDGWLEPYFLVR